MEKMIKFLFFTYGKVVTNPLHGAEGHPDEVVVEGIARHGEVVDLQREYDIQRGEELGAFYTDEERKAIEDGSYSGPDAPALQQARLQLAQSAEAAVQAVEGEGQQVDVANMSAEELADYITENGLTVPQTVELAGEGDDVDRINKVLDAEDIAMQEKGGARAGVVKALEARAAQS